MESLENRIVVKVQMEGKNSHTFSNGVKIVFLRDYNNFDRKHTQISQGEVIDGGDIPVGSIILFHHNATHEVNQLFDLKRLSGEDIASDVRHFAIPETMCYGYYDGEDWRPMKGYEFALRVFRPIETTFYGLAPKLIKDTLYIRTGELKGKVVHTLRACDYTVIFNGFDGQEKQIIRCRHFPGKEKQEREEIVAINTELTKGVEEGKIFVGLKPTDAKPLSEYVVNPYVSKLLL